MSLETDIRDIIIGDGTIAGIVGTRVRPVALDQQDARPSIRYSVTVEPRATYTGPATYHGASLELSALADTYAECAELSAELRDLLHAYSGTTATVTIKPSLLEDESDIEQAIEEATGRPIYVRTLFFRMQWRTN